MSGFGRIAHVHSTVYKLSDHARRRAKDSFKSGSFHEYDTEHIKEVLPALFP